jgi:hypothetical protein
VINYSLLGIDWYINQLRYKVNQSDPIDVLWTADQIVTGKRDYITYVPNASYPENRYYDLDSVMRNYVGNDQYIDEQRGDNTYPVKKFSVPVDKDFVLKNGTVNAKDSGIVDHLQFDLPRNSLQKNDLAVLNVIAANKWKRPIYFTNNSPYQINLGFEKYLRLDGLSYRLVPIENGDVNADWAMDKVMNKFGYGNAQIPGVYYDEENRRHLITIRDAHADIAMYLANHNRKEDARKVLEKCDKMMLQQNMPYGMASRSNQHNRASLAFLQAAYAAEDKDLAEKVYSSVKKDLEQQLVFYAGLNGINADNMEDDKQMTQRYLSGLEQIHQQYTTPQKPIIDLDKRQLKIPDSSPKKTK